MTIVVCPNCGHHFTRPFITEKRSGLGITFGPLGEIKCPQCGFKAGWGKFKNEKDVPPGTPVNQQEGAHFPDSNKEKRDEAKSLDETKYEDQQ
jgi:DNA-directed RNA polymerase subunit RPC12/RpoP